MQAHVQRRCFDVPFAMHGLAAQFSETQFGLGHKSFSGSASDSGDFSVNSSCCLINAAANVWTGYRA